MVFLAPLFFILCEVVWQIIIKYPPTLEQIHLGVSGPVELWLVRFICLILVILTIFFFSFFASNKTKKYYWILVLASPVLSLLCMTSPLNSLKLFIISVVFYLLARTKKSYITATIVSILIILILNIGIFKQNPKILEDLSLGRSQAEVTYRFTTEDNVKPHIEIPTVIRRIGYNKYFISLKKSADSAMTFFDFETMFFQEVHPMDQKAFVIFFWPEIFIFCISIWFVANKRFDLPKGFLPILLISFVYFITSSGPVELRFILILFPLSILMSKCIEVGLASNNSKIKMVMIFLLFVTFYGWATNYYDRYVRPDYWLDNHPIAYNFVLNYLKNNQNLNDIKVQVPDTLYAVRDYCPYYFKDCSRFKYGDFNMLETKTITQGIYVGFTSNFLLPTDKNISIDQIKSTLSNNHLEILQMTHILNNIANGYGQELIIAQKK